MDNDINGLHDTSGAYANDAVIRATCMLAAMCGDSDGNGVGQVMGEVVDNRRAVVEPCRAPVDIAGLAAEAKVHGIGVVHVVVRPYKKPVDIASLAAAADRYGIGHGNVRVVCV